MNLTAFNNPIGWIIIAAIAIGTLSALGTIEFLYIQDPHVMIPMLLSNIITGAGAFVTTILGGVVGAHITIQSQSAQVDNQERTVNSTK